MSSNTTTLSNSILENRMIILFRFEYLPVKVVVDDRDDESTSSEEDENVAAVAAADDDRLFGLVDDSFSILILLSRNDTILMHT